MALNVRSATPADADVIAEFNCRLATESEGRQLDSARVRAGVAALLSVPSRGQYFLAIDPAGVIAGQLLVTYEWSDWRNGEFWWIQSVYVRPEARGQGVYRTLHRHVETVARERGNVCGLRLYVEQNNHRAQRVYSHAGLRETDCRMYEVDWTSVR